MESIDRLRKYVDGNSYINEVTASCICSLLDGIEREVECERAVAYNAGYDAGFVDDNYDADATAQHEDAMAERGWVRLPVDADGEYVHVGDKVDGDHYEDGTVTGIQFYEMANGGIRTLVAVRPDGWDVPTWHTPDEYRHHHAPTVEDVLTEMFAKAIERGELTNGAAQTIAEYAAKLRLAGDGE